jgi:hypothetical protein
MALNAAQQQLAKDIAALAGTTLHLVPDQADVQEYLNLIASELTVVATTTGSGNPVKDEVEGCLAVLNDVVAILPETTPSLGKFKAAVSFISGVAHMFGL